MPRANWIAARCPWLVGLGLVVGPSAGCSSETAAAPPVAGARTAVVFCDGPVIDSWYGETLEWGVLGHAQRDVNVLGNVSSTEGIVQLERALDDGPFVSTPVGPDSVRLQNEGDFNIVIPPARLRRGDHSLRLRAQDGTGASCLATLTLRYGDGTSWPLPYHARFDSIPTTEDIDEVVQIVDGPWVATGDGIRTVERGYYRTLAVGEHTWAVGYEARATVTVHHLGDWSGVGLGIGWQGHTGPADPPVDWPVGALGWVRAKSTGPSLEIKTFDHGTPISTPVTFDVDGTYVFEMRGEPIDAETMRVGVRMWPVSGTAPAWLEAPVDRRGGSVVLLAHGADVTWHDVDVRPLDLPDGGMPPTDGAVPAADGAVPGTDGAVPGADGAPARSDAGGGPTGGSGGSAGGCSATAPEGTHGWGIVVGLLLWLGRRRVRARSRRAPWSACRR